MDADFQLNDFETGQGGKIFQIPVTEFPGMGGVRVSGTRTG